MVGDDAAKLAVDYGKFCAVYYPALELLSYNTKCKNIDSNIFVVKISFLIECCEKSNHDYRIFTNLFWANNTILGENK